LLFRQLKHKLPAVGLHFEGQEIAAVINDLANA
jgi:hypothetical protein